MALFFIYGIIIIAFFGNSFVEYHLIPANFTLLTELFLFILMPYCIIKRVGKGFYFNIGILISFFVLITICSIIMNSQYDIRPIYSYRSLWRFPIFYLLLINLNLSENDLKKINQLILWIFIIQLPVVAIKFLFYGISELTMGTYQVRGGSLTTVLPLTVVCYVMSYYGFYKQRIVYILIGIGFMIFGLVGAKRAPFFFFPIVVLGMYYLIYIKGRKRDYAKRTFALTVIISAIISIGILWLQFSPLLISQEQKKIASSLDEKVQMAFQYAKDYTTRTDYYTKAYTYGRFSTTTRVLDVIWGKGIGTLFFGLGPGCYTRTVLDPPNWRSKHDRILKIRYGLTPANFIAIEYGLFGVCVYAFIAFYFIVLCWKCYKRETNPYWKAFATGTLGLSVVMMVLFFIYHYPIFLGDTMPVLYYYVIAAIFLRTKQRDTLVRSIIDK